MSKKAAFIIAGVITSIVMVLTLGLVGGGAWFNQPAAAASTENSSATETSAVCANPDDVATLQAQLNDYQAALQQANDQLQVAYDQIAAMQTQGRFRGEHEEHEHEGFFFNPFDND